MSEFDVVKFNGNYITTRSFCIAVAKLGLSPVDGFTKRDVIGMMKSFSKRFGRD